MIIDAHSDTILLATYEKDYELRENDGHISLMKLKEIDSLCQFFALYIDRDYFDTKSPYEIFSEMYNMYTEQITKNNDLILPAYSAEDIFRNREAGKMSALLAIEDAVCAEGKIERIDEFFEKGVRAMTLVWNFENELAFPNSVVHEEHMKGLKPFGLEAIEKMNKLGMLVDVSHLSEGGFYDVAKFSKKPFIATHSCARALCNHQRNLTDDQLKTLGKIGGVVGVNFEASFLKEDSENGTYDQIVEHTKYMVNKAGIEAVGFGSDFDGIPLAGEIGDCRGFTRLIELLTKHFTDDEIDLISYKNMIRILKENIK
ncbi:MAG: membrane dipeptidase [Peptostreptococcaceae bacterium]|nr:membrane dipeptidase [Peptostreptococcaceae bacterium]